MGDLAGVSFRSEGAVTIRQMKERVETEEKQGLLYFIDDPVAPRHRFSERRTVDVHYRWRPTIEDTWRSGSITFSQEVDSRPDYSELPPKRNPSASGLKQQRQKRLYGEWEHLIKLALYSVKEYFKDGGDRAMIPRTFHAKADSHTRRLNNFSANFWLVQPATGE